MRMTAIAAVDQNWGIGKNGQLLVSIPEDQRDVFRKHTLHSTVVYGRKTLDTFQGERLLPKRTNVILSRNSDFVKEGAMIVHSEDELRCFLDRLDDPDVAAQYAPAGKIFLIGGEDVYHRFLHLCTEAIITKIQSAFSADAVFPNLDTLSEWDLEEESLPVLSVTGFTFSVCRYKRVK